jgi:hypothetical protein
MIVKFPSTEPANASKIDERHSKIAVHSRMRLYLHERKATEAEIAGWLKGKLTTSRIHDFAKKYPVSYDWLLTGDLKGLLRMAKGFPHGAPSPLPQQKTSLQQLLDTFTAPQMAAVSQLFEVLNQKP